MRLGAVSLLLVLLGALLAGCGGESAPDDGGRSRRELAADKGAIAGLVIDDRYRPVPNAFLLLTPVGLTTDADAEGQFEFLDLAPGAYVLQVQADGHEGAPLALDIVAGQYTEVEAEARRIFSNDNVVITTQYSVFIGCAYSIVEQTGIGMPVIGEDCMLDQSGDSSRFGFNSRDYTSYGKNVTYLITEMKANHKASSSNGAYKVVVRDATDADPYYASKFTLDGDYLRLTLKYGNVSLDDTENRNKAWKNKEELQTALFPQGGFKGETQQGLDAACNNAGQGCFESRGLGFQFGVKARFVQTLFVGEPSITIDTYCVLSDDCLK